MLRMIADADITQDEDVQLVVKAVFGDAFSLKELKTEEETWLRYS